MIHSAFPRAVELIAQEWTSMTEDVDAQARGNNRVRLDSDVDSMCELQACVQDADLLDMPVEYLVALVREVDYAGWIVGWNDLEKEVLRD